eukprot:6183370-Pleurochrysis_carterae.AAC.2
MHQLPHRPERRVPFRPFALLGPELLCSECGAARESACREQVRPELPHALVCTPRQAGAVARTARLAKGVIAHRHELYQRSEHAHGVARGGE